MTIYAAERLGLLKKKPVAPVEIPADADPYDPESENTPPVVDPQPECPAEAEPAAECLPEAEPAPAEVEPAPAEADPVVVDAETACEPAPDAGETVAEEAAPKKKRGGRPKKK